MFKTYLEFKELVLLGAKYKSYTIGGNKIVICRLSFAEYLVKIKGLDVVDYTTVYAIDETDVSLDTLPLLKKTPICLTSNIEVGLPSLNAPDVLLYEYVGSGKFIAAWFVFNSDDVLFTVEFDGKKSLDAIDLEFIDDFSHDNNWNNYGFIKFNKDKSMIGIEYPAPKKFEKSFKVYARCHKNSDKHKLEKYMIQLTKEV